MIETFTRHCDNPHGPCACGAWHSLKLTDSQRTELKACLKRGFVEPRFDANGVMQQDQWATWQELHNMGLGEIEGMGEAEDFSINELGRIAAKKREAAQ